MRAGETMRAWGERRGDGDARERGERLLRAVRRLGPAPAPSETKAAWARWEAEAKGEGGDDVAKEFEHEGTGVDEVFPRVLLSSRKPAGDAALLTSLGVTHVVACHEGGMDDVPPALDVKRLELNLTDRESTDIRAAVAVANAFLDAALLGDKDAVVLVFCGAGISRSPAIVMGFLMMWRGYSLHEAYALVKTGRHFVDPNPGFVRTLRAMEREVATTPAPPPRLSDLGKMLLRRTLSLTLDEEASAV